MCLFLFICILALVKFILLGIGHVWFMKNKNAVKCCVNNHKVCIKFLLKKFYANSEFSSPYFYKAYRDILYVHSM
jgi:hypothetical protein